METSVVEDDTVTMLDVLREQEEIEENANAVLGSSDDKNCTYSLGYIKRQAIYACQTCSTDSLSPTAICLACSLKCHEKHDLLELYTKRNFRCDCPTSKLPESHSCCFLSEKLPENKENHYNQNFKGLYCVCHRPYPDPESTEPEKMIQCVFCEDWLHSSHLEARVPNDDQYSEMICKSCMSSNDFLYDYPHLMVEADNDGTNISCDDTMLDVTDTNETLDVSAIKNEDNLKETGTSSPIAMREIDSDSISENVDSKNDDNLIESANELRPEVVMEEEPDKDLISNAVQQDQISGEDKDLLDQINEACNESSSIQTEEKVSESQQLKNLEQVDKLNPENVFDSSESVKMQCDTNDIEVSNEDESSKISSEIKDVETNNTTDSSMICDKEETMDDKPLENAVSCTDVQLESENMVRTDGTENEVLDTVTESKQIDFQTEPSELSNYDNSAKDNVVDKVEIEKQEPNTKLTGKIETNDKVNELEDKTNIKVNEEEKETNIKTNEEEKETNIKVNEEENETNIKVNEEENEINIKVNDEENETNIKVNEEEKETDIKVNEENETNIKVNEENETNIKVNEEENETNIKVNEEENETNIKLNEKENETNMQANAQEDKIEDGNEEMNADKPEDISSDSKNEISESTIQQGTNDESNQHATKNNESIIENLADIKNTEKEEHDDDEIAKDSENDTTENGNDRETENGDKTQENMSGIDNENIMDTDDVDDNELNKHNSLDREYIQDDLINGTEGIIEEVGSDNIDKPIKRKLDGDEGEDSKKPKLSNQVCTRQKSTIKRPKGATFWSCNWRTRLCTCHHCIAMYRDKDLMFLLDPDDTVSAYEEKGKEKNGELKSQYEQGMDAFQAQFDRVQQINAFSEYNKMKEKLLDFLKGFKDKQEVVKEEDIKKFFEDMKPTRKDDGVYFCI